MSSRVLRCGRMAAMAVACLAVAPAGLAQDLPSLLNGSQRWSDIGPTVALGAGTETDRVALGVNGTAPRSCLQFDGSSSYVAMGRAPELGLSTFTLECWFKKTGTGQEVGTDQISAYPLICKGHHQEDGSRRDANYFLGIKSTGNVLAADFEDMASGTNHPVKGTTVLQNNVWYHAAATYDLNSFRLYLNGQLEAQLACTATPRYDSHQHFSVGTAMNTTGAPKGFFNGLIDEVRVWNVARTQQQVQDTMYVEAVSDPSLVGHWTLDENTGSTAGDSGTAGVTGFIHDGTWTAGVSFDSAPQVCTLAATNISDEGGTLNGTVIDLGGAASATVSFHWGFSPDLLDQSTSPQTLTAPGAFAAAIDGTLGTTYFYRAVADLGGGPVEGPLMQFLAADGTGLTLDGATWVGIGNTSGMGLTAFTLECWFKPTGPGNTTDSGSGGVSGIPLITKGRGISDGGTQDCNWFLAIRGIDQVLAADFEDMPNGVNHPIVGATPVQMDVWQHAAATYDGSTWRLYLNGRLEAESFAGANPRSNSESIVAIGSTLNSDWIQEGNFEGQLDEVRIWNCARSREEIVSSMNCEVATAPGLVARWGFNEGIGPSVADSSGNGWTGYVSNGAWGPGSSFDVNALPDVPSPLAPAENEAVIGSSVDLRSHVADIDSSALEVKFFGRKFHEAPAAPFRIIALPDTQYYSKSYPGTFNIQTNWIVNNRDALSIAYVAHLGDIVDSATSTTQWSNANTAISLLDTLQDLPYGLCVGNHDENPNGNPGGTTAFNNYFPYTRYEGVRSWYGGHYGDNNDNHYILFTAGNMNFIAIHIKYNTALDQNVLSWVQGLLQEHSDRRAIIVGHSILRPLSPPVFSDMGSAIYETVKDSPNVFMMLNGHFGSEAGRTDVTAVGTIHSMLSDYQWLAHGGNGWLRILEFVPGDNAINVSTYSPKLNQWQRDDNSQFSLRYEMGGVSFEPLATRSAPGSGADVTATWTGLESARTYEWYVTASDGKATVSSPVQRFTTPPVAPDFNTDGSVNETDLSRFLDCAAGPSVPYDPEPPQACILPRGPDRKLSCDFDKDGDVDVDDFGVLQRCYSAGDPALPDCAGPP